MGFLTKRIKYGTNKLDLVLPDYFSVDTILPQDTPAAVDPHLSAREAVRSPLNFAFHAFRGVKSAAIAINDKTRPVPHDVLLPPILQKLGDLGIPPHAVTLIIASGTHSPMREAEYAQILPREILRKYRVIVHDCDDRQNLVSLGRSSRGTPILINRTFADSDLRIVVGNIEPHHFMGFSGGVKSASIGLAGRETITINHSLMLDRDSRAGEFDKNKMRQEVEEIGRICGVHFALNAILNNDRQIVKVYAGDPYSVMEQGVKLVRTVCQTEVNRKYDLVIASAGGSPKDLNLYQSQKALVNAARIVKNGGVIILAAECIEGIGSYSLEEFMEGVHSWHEVIVKFEQAGFQVGPHKALQMAHIAQRAKIILVSSIDAQKVKELLLIHASSIQQAISMAEPNLVANSSIAILPLAVTTIPDLKFENHDPPL